MRKDLKKKIFTTEFLEIFMWRLTPVDYIAISPLSVAYKNEEKLVLQDCLGCDGGR